MNRVEKLHTVISQEPALFAAFAIIIAWMFYSAVSEGWRRYVGSSVDDHKSRMEVYRFTNVSLWLLASVCVIAWMASGRTLHCLGFSLTPTFGFIAAAGFTGFLIVFQLSLTWRGWRSKKARDGLRKEFDKAGPDAYDRVAPAEAREYPWYYALAITAGITEEIIFRGFMIGFLGLWFPIWQAAIMSVLIFAIVHIYQGVAGIMRILPITAILTALFVISGSIIPSIILHIVVDILSGVQFWLLRQASEARDD